MQPRGLAGHAEGAQAPEEAPGTLLPEPPAAQIHVLQHWASFQLRQVSRASQVHCGPQEKDL